MLYCFAFLLFVVVVALPFLEWLFLYTYVQLGSSDAYRILMSTTIWIPPPKVVAIMPCVFGSMYMYVCVCMHANKVRITIACVMKCMWISPCTVPGSARVLGNSVMTYCHCVLSDVHNLCHFFIVVINFELWFWSSTCSRKYGSNLSLYGFHSPWYVEIFP